MIHDSCLCWQGLLWVLLLFPAAAMAQDASCGNVTISSAADADAIRKTCKTITGNLMFDWYFNETVNLDGIEVIEGDFWHEGDGRACLTAEEMDKFPCLARFNISSSTLRQINGDISFWAFNGLEELILPNLVRVKQVSLKRLHDLQTLDLTNLQYIQDFWLEAKNLSKFSLDGLKEFTGPYNGGVYIVVGSVDNLDGLFKNNLDPWQGFTDIAVDADGYMHSGLGVDLSYMHAPNLKTLTFGWKRVPNLRVGGGSEMSIVFGGPNSTEVEISTLQLYDGVGKLERGKTLKNLKVGLLSVRDTEKMERLEVPFDQLWSLEIRNATELTSVILPPQAESWTNFSLNIFSCPNLNLSSEYSTVDGERKKTWYWPRGDWVDLTISANMTNEFL